MPFSKDWSNIYCHTFETSQGITLFVSCLTLKEMFEHTILYSFVGPRTDKELSNQFLQMLQLLGHDMPIFSAKEIIVIILCSATISGACNLDV